MPKKLGIDVAYDRDTTLSSLWKAWMSLNRFAPDDAKELLRANDIRCNLDGALADRWDEAVLTRYAEKILAFTGIDVERFVMVEAKRRVAAAHPELAKRIVWNQWNTRAELIDEIRAWKELYGGTQYIALQMGVTPGVVNSWTRETSKAVPSTDKAALALAALTRGLIHTEYAEQLMYVLMVRATLGYEVERAFPEQPTFERAHAAFFRPYAGWTIRKIAGELDIKDGAVQTLKDWKPQSGKGTLYHQSVEIVVRALVQRRWPGLETRFDELRAEYRLEEEQGTWAVKRPLYPPLDAPEHAVAQPAPAATPTDTRTDEALALPAIDEDPPQPRADPPAERPVPAANPARSLEEKLALIAAFSVEVYAGRITSLPERAPTQRPIPEREPGETLREIRNCLTRAGFRNNPGGRANQEQVREVAAAISRLRRELVGLAELDPQHLRREVLPVVLPEFFELLIALEGMRHLLGTDEAWQIINGWRAGMSITRHSAGD